MELSFPLNALTTQSSKFLAFFHISESLYHFLIVFSNSTFTISVLERINMLSLQQFNCDCLSCDSIQAFTVTQKFFVWILAGDNLTEFHHQISWWSFNKQNTMPLLFSKMRFSVARCLDSCSWLHPNIPWSRVKESSPRSLMLVVGSKQTVSVAG